MLIPTLDTCALVAIEAAAVVCCVAPASLDPLASVAAADALVATSLPAPTALAAAASDCQTCKLLVPVPPPPRPCVSEFVRFCTEGVGWAFNL